MALLFDLLRSTVITDFVSSPAAYFRSNLFFPWNCSNPPNRNSASKNKYA